MIIESYKNKMQSGSCLKNNDIKNLPNRFRYTILKESCFFTLIVSIFLLILSTHANALSNSGGGTWQFYREITINNTGEPALSDYQIKLNLTGAAFPLSANASGADIRFEQGGVELSYWIEMWDHANARALVWANVTNVPVGKNTVRMWYGNPDAISSSDVIGTFIRVIDSGQPVEGSWNFEEGSGTIAYDSSGKGNNGVLVNGPLRVNGKFGNALRFNGVDNYVNLPDNGKLDFSNQDFTVSAWFNLSEYYSANTLCKLSPIVANDDWGWKIGLTPTGIINFGYYFNNINADGIVSTFDVSLNSWYRVDLVFSNSSRILKMYVNGTLNNEKTISSGYIYYDNMDSPSIGAKTHCGGQTQIFNGLIDEVNIFNRILIASEISDLYNNYGYTTTNFPGRVLVGKYTLTQPSIIVGAESSSVLSNSGGGTWKYYQDMTINNTGGAPLTDYQILVNLTGSAFPLRANNSGADIRFEQGGIELSYWIEKWDNTNAGALLWVNVTNVPVGSSVIGMWYGNDKASGVSNVNSTFIKVIDNGKPLVGSWNFDEGTGTTAYDSSGKGNNGALVNGPTWLDGKFGKAMSFDGVNDYVSLPVDFMTTPTAISVVGWFNTSSKTSSAIWPMIFSIEGAYAMYINSDGSFLPLFDGSSVGDSAWGAGYNDGLWHNFVAINDGTTTKLYLDNTLIGNRSESIYNINLLNRPSSIGSQYHGNEKYFNGIIDEVNIYNRAISESEISYLYSNYGYTTTNYPGRVLVRKYASPEPTLGIKPTEMDYELTAILFIGTLKEGRTIEITAKITNHGPGNVSSGSMVGFYIDGTFLDKNTIPGLPSGESTNTTMQWIIPAGFSGIHTARAITDFDNILIETNETNNEKAIEFNINVVPVVNITSPVSASFWDKNVTIIWNITDKDSNIFDSTIFYRKDTAPFTVLALVGNNTSFIWNTSFVPEGKYQIRFNTSDGEDTGTATSGFYIDHNAPTSLALDIPANNSMVFSDPVQFRFNVTDNVDPVLTCDLVLDGGVNKTVNANRSQLTSVLVAGISEGDHSWYAICKDDLGRSIESETRSFIVDREVPQVTIVAPSDNYSTDISSVNVSFTSFDSSDALLFCEVRVNGAAKASVNASRYEMNNVTVAPFVAGTYNWNVQCKDDVPNIGAGEIRYLNVTSDLKVENLTFDPNSPPEGTSTTIKANVSNMGKVAAENAQVDVSYSTLIGTKYVTLQPGETKEISLIWGLSSIASGEHNITLRAILPVDPVQSNNLVTRTITIQHDLNPPYFSSITRSPVNITEGTQNVTFFLQVFDSSSGVNDASVKLNYRAGNLNTEKSMIKSGNTYSAVLTKADVDWDFYQGEIFFFNISAQDKNGNLNLTPTGSELIDIINDVPTVTIFAPVNTSQWAGVTDIVFNVNNDGEGPVNSTIYFWEATVWAPPYEENASEYFKQGKWVKISDAGNSSVVTWDTAGRNGYTRINITTTDGFYIISKLSDIFVIDNTKPIIRIDNFLPGNSYVTKPAAQIFGEVNSVYGNITNFEINDTRFVLALDPRGKRKSSFRFTSNVDILENFSVKLNASDLGGNSAEKEAHFILDNSSPVIENVSFENTFTNDLAVIKVHATDDFGIQQVQADLPSGHAVLSLVDGIYSNTFKAPQNVGVYPVNVTVTDNVNNTAFVLVDLAISQGPDLTVSPQDIVFDPVTTTTGQRVNITALIRNPAGKFANNVNITYKAKNATIGRDSINITDVATSKISWDTTGFAGNISVYVIIEKSTGVFESNYSNNNASREIIIDAPDLSVTDITFNPQSPVYEGQVVTITSKIVNHKPINANNVRISFYENKVDLSGRIDFKDVSVPANGLVEVSLNWQTAGKSGTQIIFVEANTIKIPAEADFSNNILNATFETKKYISEQIPDLLTFPPKPLPGIAGEKVRGMASNDFDHDNKTDFVAGTDKGKIILYKNNGIIYINNTKSKSVNFTQVLIDDIGEAAWGMTSADLFGDNYPDLIVGTQSGRIIFYNNSFGVFVNNITLLDVGDWAYGLAATDLNNDDKFDLVIGNMKGQVNLYINNMTNGLTNQSMVFDRTLTTRDQPFGLTTGDYDLDGHVDVMVGDRLGQIERIVYEIDRYNGFLFADVGAFAHGLTAADIDYSGKLDLFSTSFDGNVRLFFSREGGLVADPLIIGNIPESYGLTSGDYDSDNDIDLIVGSDSGNVTMLMNSLRIIKSSVPEPSPPKRIIEFETRIQNPWAREMIDVNFTEMWQGDLRFVKGAYPILLGCESGVCEYFYADIYYSGTPNDNSTYRFDYYLQLPNTVCRVGWKLPGNTRIPNMGCNFFNYNGETILDERSFNASNVLGIFDDLDMLRLREGFKYKYKLVPNSVTNVTSITNINYTLLGSFNTPDTNYLLSDDVTNINDITANSKNINPTRKKSDRDYSDSLIIAPDFTPISLTFSGYSYPPTPGELVNVVATIKNLNNIAINDVKAMLLIDSIPVMFGCPANCKNYTTFNIGAYGIQSVSTSTSLPSSSNGNVIASVIVNPFRDDIETNYENNNLSNSLAALPPADISNDRVYFSNGTVIKDVFTEGEPITVFTDLINLGANNSFKEHVIFLGYQGKTDSCGIIPLNRIVNCSMDSPDYDANMCSGIYYGDNSESDKQCNGNFCNIVGNMEPGHNITTGITKVLGDSKMRSQGAYNFTTFVTDVSAIDTNHANDANHNQLIILPSQEDLRFDYSDSNCLLKPTLDIDISNPQDPDIQFVYREMNDGGYNVSDYESIVYLDNNDSMILARIKNESLANHTSDINSVMINWSSITPGDHRVNFYLDFGKNVSESTARAVSNDGLIFIADDPGISGNELSVSIKNITLDTFRLNITKKKEIVEQTAFDLLTRTENETISYDKRPGNLDIMTVGDIVDVISNGGYSSGQFIPSKWLKVEINGADLTAKPTLQKLNLAIQGSLTHERSDLNNQHSTVFRWKEPGIGGITFSPGFPSQRDPVTISTTVSNSGDIRTGPFNVTFSIDNIPIETRTISLLSHESKPVSYSFTIPVGQKLSYDVKIAVDPENIITNEDESNNIATTVIPVTSTFELNLLSKEHNINFMSLFKNDGTNNFTSGSWDLDNTSMEYDASPTFTDYDRDGDLDMIVGSLDGKIRSFENTGSDADPAWKETDWSDLDWKQIDVPTVNIGGKNYNTIRLPNLDVGARSVPEFAELDNDSLMDLIVGDTHGRLNSYKRGMVGKSVYNPATGKFEFTTRSTWVQFDFNLSKAGETFRSVPSFADLDGDGDLDMIVGNQFGTIVGYENSGNSTKPDWAKKDFGLSGIDFGENSAPELADMDQDGDYDLSVGNTAGITFYENIGNRTEPVWKNIRSMSLPERTGYKPTLSDIDKDGDLDLVFGSNNVVELKLRKGYFEPVNVQVINFAKKQVDIARIQLSAVNATSGNKITDLLLDGPFNQVVSKPGASVPLDTILRGYRLESQGVMEKEYDLDIPVDLPGDIMLNVRASKQENVNPGYFYELGSDNSWLSGEKTPSVFINRPELGGNTFDLFVDPGTTYEYKGSYRVFHNGTMSRQYECLQNWCSIYNLTVGEVNTIAGSGEIRRFFNVAKDYVIEKPEEPPILLQIDNKFGLEFRPGYIEDIEVSVKNNNKRQYNINRIAIELFDTGNQTGNRTLGNETSNITVPTYDQARIINLFTDVSSLTLPSGQTTKRKYKIYVPQGVPLGAMLLVKGIEKYTFADMQFDRSNIKELWPFDAGENGGMTFSQDLPQSSLYNSTAITLFTDPAPWGKQGFDFGLGCDDGFCGLENSFLRKQVWIPGTLIKSEQKEYLHQACSVYDMEDPSGMTAWINGKFLSSLSTECDTINFGWTPNFDNLLPGRNNELDMYSFGPHRTFDITLYNSVAVDYMPGITVTPIPEAIELNITEIGNNGLLRRQYEEKVNITVKNNDDDPITLDAITLDLYTPQNKKIHLLTDSKPRTIPSLSEMNVTYLVTIPGDVALNSKLMVQAERVFEFPDSLWNRDSESNMSILLAQGTRDYNWGDTLPTSQRSKYRKHFFVPNDITRAEMILGDKNISTDAYLNGEFQGSGYQGWSPISLNSGLKEGQQNLLSVVGAIPYTNSRLYSGKIKKGGTVIEPEEEVYFAAFGIREQQYLPGREPFFVLPGEKVTARIQIENKYNKTLDYTMRLYTIDFNNQKEISLQTQTLTVKPFEIKKLEVDLIIPSTVSNETRLQLSSLWNEKLPDKNWLRGSNFKDDQVSNNYLDDAQWGVVEVGPDNEHAIYFRKHMWIDSTVQGIKISKTGVDKMWVNGLEVAGDTFKNEFTKSESNLITLKAKDFDIDADIYLDHFVPVRSTDIESTDLYYSNMFILSQDNKSFGKQLLYDCSNQALGECTYKVEKGETVRLNFTLRNTGELFARNFDLTVFAKNLDTGQITEFNRETITMHPFSTDEWNISWNTSKLAAGMNEFVVFADSDDEIIETSEFNNKVTRKIYVNSHPEIKYLDPEELQGYNENVNIRAQIIDEDGNLKNINLLVTDQNNTIEALNVSGAGNIFMSAFNDTKPGKYGIHLNATDEFGKANEETRYFDLFDSIYLNVKTEKNVYFYAQKVRLTQSRLSNLTKLVPNNRPVLLDAFDNVDVIKGGDRLTIGTNAYDPDNDLITLYICKGNQANSNGCSGGSAKTYCQSTEGSNPGCSFYTEKDDLLHDWFAFVVDEKGLLDGPVAGNYTTDSIAPETRLYSFAGNQNNLVDNQDDLRTIVTIQGEEGMSCRVGKDPVNRFHKDRSFSLLTNNCAVSGNFANCNLGDLKKEDPSRDRITNLTMAYVSCQDSVGNEQSNLRNIDIKFKVDPKTSIFDNYQGGILEPGSRVDLNGETSFCKDDIGRCTPTTKITNGSVIFGNPGVFHLRYIDADNNIKDRTIFINSKPQVSEQTFIDRLGEHAYDVFVRVSDPDDQTIACTLTNGTSTQEMLIEGGLARITQGGKSGETGETQVSCTDGMEIVSTSLSSHSFPNLAPFFRNIPDISLASNKTTGIDLSFSGFDLENDTLSYSIVSQSNTAIADSSVSSNDLTVTSKEPGISTVCLKANDGSVDGNVQCITIFVEDGSESKLKNNEFTNTTLRVLMQVQYFSSTWEDEFSKEMTLRVLPGPVNQIDLGRIFEWDSSTSSHPEGLFRVLFRGVDVNNNTLINRDGTGILDSYNFTLVQLNTPPNISGIPDQTIFENEQIPSIDLLDYTIDNEQNIEDIEYAIANQTNPGIVNCSLSEGHFISCIPITNKNGTSEINVSVFDGFAYDLDTFIINIIPYDEFAQGNITYSFVSEQFDVSGDPYSGIRYVSVSDKTPPGKYNITVIVSYGLLKVSRNISVTALLPGTPVLEPIRDKTIQENETLVIQLNATDPEGDALTFGTDAGYVLPPAITFNNTTGLFTWTPNFEHSGNYSVSFNVTDGNFSANETINIMVLNTNRPPILTSIPDIMAYESDLATINVNDTDPDNENNVTNDDNNITVFINDTRFIKNGNNFTWQTGFEDAGSFPVLITAGDGELIDSQVVNITILNVEPVQVPPKIIHNSPAGINVPIDTVINVTFNKPMNHSSGEGAFVIWPQVNGVFNWTGGKMTFIPEMLGYNITYNVTITDASEDIDGNNLQEAFTWEFTTETGMTNTPPVPVIISPANNSVISNIVEIKAITSDDDVVLTLFEFSSDGLIWTEIGRDHMGTDGWNTTWNVTLIQVGSFALRAKMTDSGGLNGTDTIYVTISRINHAPLITPIEDQIMIYSTTLQVPIYATDIDSDVITLSASGMPLFASFKDNGNSTGSIVFTPCSGINAIYPIIVSASDGNLSSSTEFNLTVNNVNLPPSGENQTVVTFENTQVLINLTASDPENDPLSFGIVSQPVNGMLSGTPPNLIYTPDPGYNGMDILAFKAFDSQSESSIAIVNITIVSNASIADDISPPVIESITTYPANTTAGSTINISVKASDNTGVVKVTANGIIFKNSGGRWLGSAIAESMTGKASVIINVIDAAGNSVQRVVNYTVVNRVGGIAITSIPKPLVLNPCSSGQLNIKLISTANIDDRVWVNITTTGISATSAINLGWFNRTTLLVPVPSKATVYVPFKITVLPGAGIGYKTFKNNARSLGFNATSVDTGIVNVK